MKRKLLVLLLFLTQFVYGQNIFFSTYTTSASSYYVGFQKAIQLSDSNYLSVGGVSVIIREILLVKSNSVGDTIWKRTFKAINNSDSQYGVDIVEDQATKNIYVLGQIFVESQSILTIEACSVLCLDSTGNIIWTQCYGDSLQTLKPKSILFCNNEIMIGGNRQINNSGDSSSFFLMSINKTNASINWAYEYGDSSYNYLTSIINTTSNEFLITAINTSDYISNDTIDALMIKLDSVGNLIWTNKIYSTYADKATEIIENNNGNYTMLISSKKENQFGKFDAYLLVTDTSGSIQWCNRYSVPVWNLPVTALAQQKNGNYFISMLYTGTTTANGINYIYTDSIGNLIESGLKGTYSNLWEVENALDDGLIINNSFGIIKTDTCANAFCYQNLNNILQQDTSSFLSKNIVFHQQNFLVGLITNDTIGIDFIMDVNLICNSATPVAEYSATKKIRLYPNPALQSLKINVDDNLNMNKCNVEIINALGKVMLAKNLSLNYDIDISELTAGVYTLKLECSKTVDFLKFIKL